MSDAEQVEDAEVVSITENGQATIPKRFREKLNLSPNEKVRFRETGSGEIVVERVPSPEEMRGIIDRRSKTDRPATEILQEKRRQDREDLRGKEGGE